MPLERYRFEASPFCFFVSGMFFFFQAEDGIRDAQESRGLGDVFKRQVHVCMYVRVSMYIDASLRERRRFEPVPLCHLQK